MFIDELKKQFRPDQVRKILECLLGALIEYDKKDGYDPESVWAGDDLYKFLTGYDIMPYWEEE